MPENLKISVVLLTLNGGKLFEATLRAVCEQRIDEPFEILAVDSGSEDGTVQVLRREQRVTLIQLPPGEFQHGRTRNLTMARTRGELVIFLTQDALPNGSHWLASWVAFMDSHREVAGAFGAQRPHEGADPLEAWEVEHHFGSFRDAPAVIRAPTEGTSAAEGLRAHFFSNVNSCIRREAWMRIPFREIPFGEDQAWASDVHRAGLATGYCDAAVVRHSHDYGPFTLLRRRYDEARFMRRHFDHVVIGSLPDAIRTARAHAGYFRAHLAQRHPHEPLRSWARAHARAWASALGNWAGARLAQHEGLAHRVLSLTERESR